MRANSFRLAAAVLLASASTAASAATMVVQVDHSIRLPLSGPAASVVIGNPKVADVSVVDSRTVYLSGRALGLTDVIVVDQLGRTVFASDVTVTTPGARVNVYRGAERSNLACAPGCQATGASTSGNTGAAPAATTTTQSTTTTTTAAPPA